MSEIAQLREQVISLTEIVNQITTNAKETQEFSEQTPLDLNSKIRITIGGVSQFTTLQAIINEAATADSLYVGSYTSISELTTAHPAPLEGSRAIISVASGEDKIAYWDHGDSEWYTPTVTVETPSYLDYIPVTASRDFLASDKGQVLVVQNSGVVLTLETTLPSDFNCCVTAQEGFDATIVGGAGVLFDDPNGSTVAEYEMISIGRIADEFIIRP